MPNRNTTPLTDEQAAYAEENRSLIEKYLQERQLPVDEFYDIAVFGYLRAVRRYLTEPGLQKYKFKTIAKSAMRSEIGCHFRSQRAKKRDGVVVELKEELCAGDLGDPVNEAVERCEASRAIGRILDACLTRSQAKIIQMKAQQYNTREIAAMCGLRRVEVEQELESARVQVIRFAPGLADMAA